MPRLIHRWTSISLPPQRRSMTICSCFHATSRGRSLSNRSGLLAFAPAAAAGLVAAVIFSAGVFSAGVCACRRTGCQFGHDWRFGHPGQRLWRASPAATAEILLRVPFDRQTKGRFGSGAIRLARRRPERSRSLAKCIGDARECPNASRGCPAAQPLTSTIGWPIGPVGCWMPRFSPGRATPAELSSAG